MVCHKSVLIPSVSVKSTLSNRNWDGFSMFLDAIASLLLPRSVCPHELTMWDSREALCGDLTLSGLDVMARMNGVERDWVRIKKCACKETTAGGNNIISIRYLLQLGDGYYLWVLDICQATLDWDWKWETGNGNWNGLLEWHIGIEIESTPSSRRWQYNLTGQGLTLSTQF